jgi:hypothetical protein
MHVVRMFCSCHSTCFMSRLLFRLTSFSFIMCMHLVKTELNFSESNVMKNHGVELSMS